MERDVYSTQKHMGIMYFADVAAAQQRRERELRQQQKKKQRELEKQQQQQQKRPRSPVVEVTQVPQGHARDNSASSAEQSELPGSAKRTSFFSLRPKSTLPTPSHDSSVWPQTSFDATDAVRRASPTEENLPGADAEGQSSWSIFGRGRKPRGNANRARSPSPTEADDESVPASKIREHKSRNSSSMGDIGSRITAPFNIVRSDKDDRQRLDSSKGRVLKKANIPPFVVPSEEMQSSLAQREARPKRRPPPLRPKRSDERLEDALASAPLPQLKSMRSTESVGQPAWSQVGSPAGILSPPPRNSSRPLPSPTMIHPAFRQPSPGSPPNEPPLPPPPPPVQESEFGASGEWDRLLPNYDNRPQFGSREPVMPVSLHQVSTPVPAPTPAPATMPLLQTTFSKGPLEKVPEEPEGFASPRQSIVPKRPSVRHSKSSPSIKTIATMKSAPPAPKRSPSALAKAMDSSIGPAGGDRPISLCSETLGNVRQSIVSKASSQGEVLSPVSRDVPVQLSSLEFSWEDDIDFCYDNAAESNCDFDWKNPSRIQDAFSPRPWMPKRGKACHGPKSSTDSTSSLDVERLRRNSRNFYDESPQFGVDSTPDLGYASASSASVGPRTPQNRSAFPPEVFFTPDITLTTPQFGPLTLRENGTLSIYNPLERQRSFETKPLPAITPLQSRLRNASFNETSRPRLPPTSAPTSAPSTGMLGYKSSPSGTMRQRSASASQTRPTISVDSIVSRLRASPITSPVSPISPYDAQFVWDRPIIPAFNLGPHDSIHTTLPPRPATANSLLPRSDSASSITTAIHIPPSKPLTPPGTPSSATATPDIPADGLLILPAMIYNPTASGKASPPIAKVSRSQTEPTGQSPPPTPSAQYKLPMMAPPKPALTQAPFTSPPSRPGADKPMPASPDMPPPVPLKDSPYRQQFPLPQTQFKQQPRPASPRNATNPTIKTNVGRQSYSLFPSPNAKRAPSPILGPGQFASPFAQGGQKNVERVALEKMSRVMTN